ncbi:MAG TPA: NlpC/P60 family protein [Verrucomicrobiae bacterium]|nr:NlpC/P60 family protein [Verrucomicrobiae bacterium]
MKLTIPSRLAWLLWIAALVLYVADWLYPMSDGITRSLGILLLAVVWLGLAALMRKRRVALGAWACITLFIAAFMALPGRSALNTDAMRASDTAALRRYTGASYVWGGESPKGIDCSGLIRRGMVDGIFLRGVRTLDPGLVRWSIRLWWHDCTARDLGNGDGGMTSHLFDTPSINALDSSKLLPGDIAVTASGIHVMAYLGGDEWIEADPGPGRVITVTTPAEKNEWFRGPMKIMRWNIFQ